jgi:hypothetical protein
MWPYSNRYVDTAANYQYNASTADVDIDINGPSASVPSQKELSRDAQRAISSFRTIASLLVTNPEFRSLLSDFIVVGRDIFADAAGAVADNAKAAAEKSRPTEAERKQGVDLDKLQAKGKKAAKDAQRTSGKQVKDSLWDEVEGVKQYIDEKLPNDNDETKEKVIRKVQEVGPFDHLTVA